MFAYRRCKKTHFTSVHRQTGDARAVLMRVNLSCSPLSYNMSKKKHLNFEEITAIINDPSFDNEISEDDGPIAS